jgi:hypothetical protein
MKMKFLSGMILLFCFSVVSYAAREGVIHKNYTLDIYKTTQMNVEEIDKKYGENFRAIGLIMSNAKSMPTPKNSLGMDKHFSVIMEGLAKSGSYAYLGLSPIIYGGGRPIGISIDVVDKSDVERTQGFLPKQTKNIPDPNHLIESWFQYEKFSINEFFRTKIATQAKECGAFHCLFGFKDKKTKHFGEKFNTEVTEYKKELIDILKNDKDDLKRGAAAYLLAHLKDGNEIIEILSPSIRDASSHVRNNVMRVLAQTVSRVKNPQIPLDEVIRALSFPATVDRNKALYILESLPKEPRFSEYLLKHACAQLMSQYRLVQSNLHAEAYTVLKNISHKDYGLDNYDAWETWAKKNCPAAG